MPAKKNSEYTVGKDMQRKSTVGSGFGERSKRQKKNTRRKRGLEYAQH
ncbi:MAG: hypothetical protein ABSB40_11485 [Nitrososphaeria archaeon]|jgi:hypothetical protein